MLKTPEIFRIPQLNPGKNIEIEVNWNPDDEKTNECKVLKFKYPDGSISYVKKDHFYGLLFTIGSKEQQRKMIPQRLSEVRHYNTDLYLQMRKDCKKGDIIKVPVNLSLPSVEEEVIGEVSRRKSVQEKVKKNTSGLILPSALSNPTNITKTQLDKLDKNTQQTIK